MLLVTGYYKNKLVYSPITEAICCVYIFILLYGLIDLQIIHVLQSKKVFKNPHPETRMTASVLKQDRNA